MFSITVGKLKLRLNTFPDDWELTFAGGALEFKQVKARGDALANVEFTQLIYRDENGDLIAEDT